MLPVNSFIRSISCPEVQTIEVGVVTAFVPPTTFAALSTVVATVDHYLCRRSRTSFRCAFANESPAVPGKIQCFTLQIGFARF